jgi:uncharacterized repeat protein (TIGR03803 family)
MKFVRALVPLCVLAITSCGHGAAVTPVTVSGAPSAALAVGPNTLHVIPFFNFLGGSKGYSPLGTRGGRRGLVGSVTAMYGSTPAGGDSSCAAGNGKGCGVIYELTPGKPTYKEKVLLRFTGTYGAVPYASVDIDPSGNLYGTTYFGGVHNAGTVFKLQPSVSGGFTPILVYSFRGGKNDGAHPFAGLIEVSGKLYGTTIGGGKHKTDLCKVQGGSPDGSCGTVYSIDLTTGQESMLHSFGAENDGASPYSGLINVSGTLYGTTVLGGNASNCGTVYRISLTGDEHPLYSFSGSDGCNPYSGLVARTGWLYGTTCCGGENLGPTREGVVFKLNVSSRIEQVLHKFGTAFGSDGSQPEAALRYVNRMFYGTASHGGRISRCTDGCGTIFRIDPSSGTQYKSLWAFYGDNNGGNPTDQLLYTAGAFYGTTSTGGTKGFGNGFKLTL